MKFRVLKAAPPPGKDRKEKAKQKGYRFNYSLLFLLTSHQIYYWPGVFPLFLILSLSLSPWIFPNRNDKWSLFKLQVTPNPTNSHHATPNLLQLQWQLLLERSKLRLCLAVPPTCLKRIVPLPPSMDAWLLITYSPKEEWINVDLVVRMATILRWVFKQERFLKTTSYIYLYASHTIVCYMINIFINIYFVYLIRMRCIEIDL